MAQYVQIFIKLVILAIIEVSHGEPFLNNQEVRLVVHTKKTIILVSLKVSVIL